MLNGLRRRSAADPDLAAFLDAARLSFVSAQQAWDRADLAALSRMATEPLVEELREQLAERGPAPNYTEVVEVRARLLGVDEIRDAQVASVEFSGLIREEPSAGPSPFREVWNMTKPKEGRSGWLVAGVQALQ